MESQFKKIAEPHDAEWPKILGIVVIGIKFAFDAGETAFHERENAIADKRDERGAKTRVHGTGMMFGFEWPERYIVLVEFARHASMLRESKSEEKPHFSQQLAGDFFYLTRPQHVTHASHPEGDFTPVEIGLS